MDEDAARKRLGDIIRAERQEQFGDKKAAYTAARVNAATWDKAENGQPMREDRLVRVFKALGWTVGEGWEVLSGGEPPGASRPQTASADPVRDAIATAPLLDERGRKTVLHVYDREVAAREIAG